jgi:hypothetical protein
MKWSAALAAIAVAVVGVSGCGGGSDVHEPSAAKRPRVTSTSTSPTTTTKATTTTTLTRRQIVEAMNEELQRSCNKAFKTGQPPTVTYDDAWSVQGTQAEMLATVQECLDGKRGVTTTLMPTTTIPAAHQIRGVLSLFQDKFTDQGCSGYDGYSDIAVGASVTIRNGGGNIVATTQLSGCRFTNLRTTTFPAIPGIEGVPGVMEPIPGTPAETKQSGFMAFDFVANDVPDADFYTVEVSHRGQISFSKADLEAKGWTAELTLG